MQPPIDPCAHRQPKVDKLRVCRGIILMISTLENILAVIEYLTTEIDIA